MGTFYDSLGQRTVEMPDWLDRTGSKARGREARYREQAQATSGANAPRQPGVGTTYVTGSYRSYNPKSTPTRIVRILDHGDNVDLLSPGA